MSHDVLRWQLACCGVLAYALLCLMVWWQFRRRQRKSMITQPQTWLIAYASQTGQGQFVAEQSANTLALAGIQSQLLPLSQLTTSVLQRAERLLLILSTYGDGEAPDNAQHFVQQTMPQSLDLSQLHYAVLALGSRHYQQFCAFGQKVDIWLQTQGAKPCFARIEVDNQDPIAIEQWRRQLVHLAGTDDAPDWTAQAFSDWRLSGRQLLNPHSQGASVYCLQLEPTQATELNWQAGDVVQVSVAEHETPRDYTLVSLPDSRRVELLVRLHYRPTGEQGLASGLLSQAALGTNISLRIRQHRAFHIAQNDDKPLVLLVSGTGLAGALVHLRQRAKQVQPAPCWLIFGERQREYDFFCQDEIEQYQKVGLISRLDTVFSRDGQPLRYVQDVLLIHKTELFKWLDEGAAIYVCGSLQGIGQGVDTVLTRLLGKEKLQQLQKYGRYCRDVYQNRRKTSRL